MKGVALICVIASQICLAKGFLMPHTTNTNMHHQKSIHSRITVRRELSNTVAEEALCKAPGTAPDVDFSNLGFEFVNTRSHIKFTYKDGKWGPGELVTEPYITLHIAATALHYGQACFEGMKAYAWEDGSVRLFRPDENAKRINKSGQRVMMPYIPEDMFVDAVKEVVRDNMDYVPPYGSGGSLYIRPLLFGSGARTGLQPADEYTLLIFVVPAGNYYKGGLQPVTGVVVENYDRAAPQGVGSAKVAGNYAADLLPNIESKKKGFPISLYLDAKTKTLVEEFSTSNFMGITKDGKKYVTPESPAILPSITNKSLMTLAEDEGLEVERREIPIEEVGSFSEVGACGTAVVVTPVNSIVYKDQVIKIQEDSNTIGPWTTKLYERMQGIQFGKEDDKFEWMVKV